jgi:phosphate:Na+ symporter
MAEALITGFGGLGLFLFGMAVMTSGLKKLAGEKMHRWLGQATKTPVSGAMTGAAVTAIIQSSSATTVAAVGFVGAGLMTFAQSLGILFGANIGTTITGWAVALLGFKLQLGEVSLPLLFVAALLYLNKNHRKLRGSGKALAGFALIFLGIDFLQTGMGASQDWIDLGEVRASAFTGRVALVLIGIGITLITQSSSATVAASLTALNAGEINLPQAAAIIIGADIGTTAKAIIATIGNNAASRRTGVAHLVYNLLTGTGAFFLLPLYLGTWTIVSPIKMTESPEVVAVAFHSTFNILGVILVLPFTKQFARLIERMIPIRGPALTIALDSTLLGDPAACSQALESSLRKLAETALGHTSFLLKAGRFEKPAVTLKEIASGIDETRTFAVKTGEITDESDLDTSRLFDSLHAIDHLERLTNRLLRNKDLFATLKEDSGLSQTIGRLLENLGSAAGDISARQAIGSVNDLKQIADDLELDKPRARSDLIAAAARGKLSSDQLDDRLDACRLLRRIAYHCWRTCYYINQFELSETLKGKR